MKWEEYSINKIKELSKNFIGSRSGFAREYAKQFGVSINALDCKVEELEGEGIIKKKWGEIVVKNTDPLEEILRKFILKNKNPSVGMCARFLDKCPETILKLIASLNESGFDFRFDEKNDRIVSDDKVKLPPIDIKKLKGESIKFGLCSDFHIGSYQQSTSLIKLAYNIFEKEGMQFIVNAGDTFDGRNVYRGQDTEQWTSSADEQLKRALEIIPKTKIKQYYLSGNHCLSFKKSINYNIVRRICDEREDFAYVGDTSATFKFKNKYIVSIIHPSGSQSYSRSYRAQKIAEATFSEAFSLARSNLEKSVELPIAICIGHFHTSAFIPYMSSNIIMAGTLQSQTEYLKAKALCPDIGVWCVELCFDSKGNFIKIKPEWYDLSGYWMEGDY